MAHTQVGVLWQSMMQLLVTVIYFLNDRELSGLTAISQTAMYLQRASLPQTKSQNIFVTKDCSCVEVRVERAS